MNIWRSTDERQVIQRISDLEQLSGVDGEIRFHISHQFIDAGIDITVAGVDHQFGICRLFIRCRDSREVRDFTGPGPLVETFRIARFTRLDIGLDVDFPEGVSSCLAGTIAVRAIGL